MLVCSVSQLRRRAAIAAGLTEAAAALDAPGTGNVVFATLVDDPASVGEYVDAYLGEIMLEAASADSDANAGFDYTAAIVEAATAADAQSATVPALGAPLDTVASVTGAWSLSRNMLTSFGAGTRYTKTGTAITALNDQSGNSRNLTDGGTAAHRPTEVTAFPTSITAADFDGSANYLGGSNLLSNFITASSGAVVISAIVKSVTQNQPASYNNHAIMADTGYMGIFAKNASGATFMAYNWDGTEDVASIVGAVNIPYVFMWRHNAGNIYLSVNGGTEVSVASGNTQNIGLGFYMGLGQNAGTVCSMKVAEAFTTSDGSQTTALATAIANMKTYCGA